MPSVQSICLHLKYLAGERFLRDDGSLAFAKATGIYVDGLESPVFPDRISPAGPDFGAKVIMTFGQSNAANTGAGHYQAQDSVSVFNIFDMKFYRAIDPLPGTSNNGAAVWGRLGDLLVSAGVCESVVFVPIAVGGSFIRDWIKDGPNHRRLIFALHRLQRAQLKPDWIFWHQGEAEANLTDMSAKEYRDHFRSIVWAIRRRDVFAPVWIAVATLCATADHPFKNRDQIRAGQIAAASLWRRIRRGPDTDEIGVEHRFDGCHFAESGLALHAQAWFEVLTHSKR